MRGFFIFEGTPSFLKKYQKGTPSLLIAVPQPQVILERRYKKPFDQGISESWCRQQELNLRPTRYECVALPTELCRRCNYYT